MLVDVFERMLKASIKDKRKKKSFSVRIKSNYKRTYIGFVAIMGLAYLFNNQVVNGNNHEFTYLMWFGMFLSEIHLAMMATIKFIWSPIKKHADKLRQEETKQNGINEKNAYHLNNMLRSIK